MTRTLTVKNETHWKTSDVQRIVRAAIEAVGASVARPRSVKIKWQDKGARAGYRVTGIQDEITKIEVLLPRKGPKLAHPNGLIALAAAGIEADTPMLAISDSYFLANGMAAALAKEAVCHSGSISHEDVVELEKRKRSIDPPAWCSDATTLVITKYADPRKDGTFVAFKEKKEAEIESAQGRIDKWQAEFERAKKNVARARRDKKKAQDALAAAKKRREQ